MCIELYVTHLLIFFRVASQAPGQSYDCPNASEVILKNIGKSDCHKTTTKHKACANSLHFLYKLKKIVYKPNVAVTWVNPLWPSDAISQHRSGSTSVGSGNGLLPDGTKPLPEPMLTYYQQGLVTFIWEQLQEIPQPSISLKSISRKYHSNLPGANGLTLTWWGTSLIIQGVGGAVRFLVVGTIGQGERPPVSSGWSSVWHRSNTGLSSTQYEQIPIILGVWPFWLTPFFFWSITFWRAYG